MSGEKRADMQEIRRALDVLFLSGEVVELRALDVVDRGRRRTVSGYFDDFEQLAKQSAELSGTARGVYVTLNPIDPALLARRANRTAALEGRDAATTDNHVVARRWLPIDLDASAVSGVSATDEEHGKAVSLARRIREELRAVGWPEPILADSGNGAHLLYAIHLPVDAGDLPKGCLEALHKRFSDDVVKVDRTVHNPARIWKLYGTMARKGDDSPNRPHRLARLLEVPGSIEPVSREQLEQLASETSTGDPSRRPRGDPSNGFDLEEWLAEHGLEVDGPNPWQGGRLWTFAVCPWNEEHRNRSAWVAQFPSGAVTAGCHHNGCSEYGWTDLKALYADDEVAGDSDTDDEADRRSQASRIVDLVDNAGAELWHTPDDEAYITIRAEGHYEHYPLRGRQSDLWLRRLYYRSSGGHAASNQAITDALNVLHSKALFDGSEHAIFVRMAAYGDDVYLDLAGPDWSAVRISATGWQTVSQPPVRFRRPRGMHALPTPAPGGSLSMLRGFLNVGEDEDFKLLVTALIAMFFPAGPYPVLILNGEQGSAKSTAARVLRALVDPMTAPVRSEPRTEQDLAISANNSWVVALDNLSGIRPWLSDGLCRLATGGGFATRQLYTDADEVLLEIQRPVIVNGIDELASRSDLLDRSLSFVLPAIREDQRRDEEEFWAAFERDAPLLLGAILDALVCCKHELPRVQLDRLPRLADFARRGVAMAEALDWTKDEFLQAYASNRAAGHAGALENSPVGRAVLSLMADGGAWTGTATALLRELQAHVDDAERNSRIWPRSPNALSNALRRVVPNLRSYGLQVEFRKDSGRKRQRLIDIWVNDDTATSSGSSEASEGQESNSGYSGVADEDADDRPHPEATTSEAVGFDADEADDADDEDSDSSHVRGRECQPSAATYRVCPRCADRPAPSDGVCFRCREAEA